MSPSLIGFGSLFQVQTRLHGAEDPDTLVTQSNLSHVYSNSCKYTEAVELDRQVPCIVSLVSTLCRVRFLSPAC